MNKLCAACFLRAQISFRFFFFHHILLAFEIIVVENCTEYKNEHTKQRQQTKKDWRLDYLLTIWFCWKFLNIEIVVWLGLNAVCYFYRIFIVSFPYFCFTSFHQRKQIFVEIETTIPTKLKQTQAKPNPTNECEPTLGMWMRKWYVFSDCIMILNCGKIRKKKFSCFVI